MNSENSLMNAFDCFRVLFIKTQSTGAKTLESNQKPGGQIAMELKFGWC